mgnify:CR=1 FL=1
MGIIRAIGQAIGGTLADQWLEVIEADDMSDKTVFTSGVLIRKGQNSNGILSFADQHTEYQGNRQHSFQWFDHPCL